MECRTTSFHPNFSRCSSWLNHRITARGARSGVSGADGVYASARRSTLDSQGARCQRFEKLYLSPVIRPKYPNSRGYAFPAIFSPRSHDRESTKPTCDHRPSRTHASCVRSRALQPSLCFWPYLEGERHIWEAQSPSTSAQIGLGTRRSGAGLNKSLVGSTKTISHSRSVEGVARTHRIEAGRANLPADRIHEVSGEVLRPAAVLHTVTSSKRRRAPTMADPLSKEFWLRELSETREDTTTTPKEGRRERYG